ncbi:hypothetical protein NL676_034506 [Syzygium grande]|nr:hypothetical protein NL676_034506 [Syzygium grande]
MGTGPSNAAGIGGPKIEFRSGVGHRIEDSSDLLGFIEQAFEFVAERSDFLAHEAAERDIAAVLRAVREKQKQKLRQVERERESAKKAKAAAAAAKKVEEEKKVQEVEMKDAKEEKEEKSGVIGHPNFYWEQNSTQQQLICGQ